MKLDEFPALNPPRVQSGEIFVYILQSPDGAFYIGSAGNVGRRIDQHCSGRGANFTRENKVTRLVYCEGPFNLESAVRREQQLKRWSRAQKVALISGDLTKLKSLSRSKGGMTFAH